MTTITDRLAEALLSYLVMSNGGGDMSAYEVMRRANEVLADYEAQKPCPTAEHWRQAIRAELARDACTDIDIGYIEKRAIELAKQP